MPSRRPNTLDAASPRACVPPPQPLPTTCSTAGGHRGQLQLDRGGARARARRARALAGASDDARRIPHACTPAPPGFRARMRRERPRPWSHHRESSKRSATCRRRQVLPETTPPRGPLGLSAPRTHRLPRRAPHAVTTDETGGTLRQRGRRRPVRHLHLRQRRQSGDRRGHRKPSAHRDAARHRERRRRQTVRGAISVGAAGGDPGRRRPVKVRRHDGLLSKTQLLEVRAQHFRFS
mmetsp:Transcript_24926/g.42386  ORF Transcript_24926/g.42386 Transcript_24926/m.42386 type:complete len:236 (-) Transcript_24926:1492-2199(-)